MIRSFRSLIIAILALVRGLNQKQVGARADLTQKQISFHLQRPEMDDEVYERLLAGLQGRPAEVAVVTRSLEALEAMKKEGVLTVEELDAVEMGVLEASQIFREHLTALAVRSRAVPALTGYPRPGDLEPLRWLARDQWERLQTLPDNYMPGAIQAVREFHNWALAELLCEESVVQASRDLQRAAFLARLAQQVADRVRGPEGWCNRVRGYVAGHPANILRVQGKLREAEAVFEEAKQLWHAGSDPDDVLDPGRLLDLEASLRRDQRRFEEALKLLDEATVVSRSKTHTLINKGFTLEVMGEYERAIKALLEAQPLVEKRGDPRLSYMLHFNLAVNYTHLSRFVEASELSQQVRAMVIERGDQNEVSRVTWLDGRIAAGTGQTLEARTLLEQAWQEFAARGMWYDVALALLELAVMLLTDEHTTEIKSLAQSLVKVFEANGIHREALAALRLFWEAAEHETATADLARRVLRFLFRARYDQGLRFEP
jgi:tetratricopeptide (TPR) repeat protein